MYYPRKIPSSFQKQNDCTTSAPVILESKEKYTTVSVRNADLSPYAAFLFLELLKKKTASCNFSSQNKRTSFPQEALSFFRHIPNNAITWASCSCSSFGRLAATAASSAFCS